MKRVSWLIPATVLIGIIMVYPSIRTLMMSLHEVSLANSFKPEFIGLENYTRLIGDSRFRAALWNTTVFTALSVAIEFSLGLLLALAADSWVRGRDAVRTILLVPWMLPTAVIAVLWTWIFNDQYGILNSLLVRAGLLSAPISWLGDPLTAMGAVVLSDVWKTTPFVFIILLAGLQSIPRDLYEALEMDGGGSWAKFRLITWPYLARFIFIAVIFRTIQAFSIFDLVYVMTGGGPAGRTETVSIYAYQTMMRYLDFGYAAALAVAIVLVLAAFALTLYLLTVRRHEEAV